jgi:hypothetical protein
LLANFRLLEAAGACGLIAAGNTEDLIATKPAAWWKGLADCARTYRAAIYRTMVDGFSAIDEWSRSTSSGRDADLDMERARLGEGHRRWRCEAPGGPAYLAWLTAYVAIAELDGERALSSLEVCAAIMREFADVPELGNEPSVYEFLQSAADALGRFLPLPEHPVRDVRRFALMPGPLGTGYGS